MLREKKASCFYSSPKQENARVDISIVEVSWRMSEETDILTTIKHCTEAINDWSRRLRSRYIEAINYCRRDKNNFKARRIL